MATIKTIKEKSEEHAPYTREDSWSRTQRCIIAQTSFEAGANYVLDEIENFIKDLDLGNSAEEKFYKLDLIADLGLHIKELKGESLCGNDY